MSIKEHITIAEYVNQCEESLSNLLRKVATLYSSFIDEENISKLFLR